MLNYLVSVRMECPPATKRVPLHMLGWVVMLETGAEDNVFKTSQLLMDRPGSLMLIILLLPKNLMFCDQELGPATLFT